jgi:hypothetical protein
MCKDLWNLPDGPGETNGQPQPDVRVKRVRIADRRGHRPAERPAESGQVTGLV